MNIYRYLFFFMVLTLNFVLLSDNDDKFSKVLLVINIITMVALLSCFIVDLDESIRNQESPVEVEESIDFCTPIEEEEEEIYAPAELVWNFSSALG